MGGPKVTKNLRNLAGTTQVPDILYAPLLNVPLGIESLTH